MNHDELFDLRRFGRINLRRCTEAFGHSLGSWSLAEWTNAVCGEAGEAANVAKKLLRFRDSVAGNVKPEDKDQNVLKARLARELADVIIYCDLAIQACGLDTSTVLAEVFDAKSKQLGSDILVGEKL